MKGIKNCKTASFRFKQSNYDTIKRYVTHIIQITENNVIDKYCELIHTTRADLFSKNRANKLIFKRMVLYYILRNKIKCSLQNIGNLAGGRNHATIIHSLEKIEYILNSNLSGDKSIKNDAQYLIKEIDNYLQTI